MLRLETPISTILKSNHMEVVFSENNFSATTIHPKEIEDSLSDVSEEIDYKLKTGKCSHVLKNQLAIHRINGYEKYNDEYHHYHYATIRDSIEAIEVGHPINIRPFNRSILAGLKHFHHNSDTFLQNNVLNYWMKQVKGKDEIEHQNNLISVIYNRLKSDYGTEMANKKSIQVLLNQIHSESIFRPDNQKTGEWVVFAEIENIKYYLCLAAHKEADEAIYERLLPCLKEFDVLNQIKIGKK